MDNLLMVNKGESLSIIGYNLSGRINNDEIFRNKVTKKALDYVNDELNQTLYYQYHKEILNNRDHHTDKFDKCIKYMYKDYVYIHKIYKDFVDIYYDKDEDLLVIGVMVSHIFNNDEFDGMTIVNIREYISELLTDILDIKITSSDIRSFN